MKHRNIDKILDNIKHDEKLNSALTEKIESDYNLISQKRKNIRLKNDIKFDKRIKLSGLNLYFLAVLGLLSTTGLSIAGGISDYSSISKFAFLIMIVFLETIIFKLTTIESIVKQSFRNHYVGLKLIQYGLLIVSIYYNYNFFIYFTKSNSLITKLITFLLCVLLDLAIVKTVKLSYDQRILNYKTSKDETSFLSMIIFNKLYNLKYKTMEQYNKNKESIDDLKCEKESIEIIENDNTKKDKQTYKPKVYKLTKGKLPLLTCNKDKYNDDSEKNKIGFSIDNLDLKVGSSDEVVNDFSNEALEEYLIYIFENKTKDNLCPGERKISDNTNLSLKQVKAIRYFLENKDIIKIDNKTTYLKTNSFDESLNLIKTNKI